MCWPISGGVFWPVALGRCAEKMELLNVVGGCGGGFGFRAAGR